MKVIILSLIFLSNYHLVMAGTIHDKVLAMKAEDLLPLVDNTQSETVLKNAELACTNFGHGAVVDFEVAKVEEDTYLYIVFPGGRIDTILVYPISQFFVKHYPLYFKWIKCE